MRKYLLVAVSLEGEAILSRFRLKDAVFTVLQPRPGFFESRVALGAAAATPWGDVAFLVTHLPGKDPQVNFRQEESLKGFVEAHTSDLAVIAGDFNAWEDSPQIAALTGKWIDAYWAIHPTDEGLTCCIDNLTASPGEPLEERIDYIFLVTKTGESVEIARARRVFDRRSRSAAAGNGRRTTLGCWLRSNHFYLNLNTPAIRRQPYLPSLSLGHRV